jgi:Protein of unknown function (DUF2800)
MTEPTATVLPASAAPAPAERGHHPDSPSSLQSSEACPCFENEQRESQAAEDGTLQHKAVETGDMDLLHGDEKMVDAVERALGYRARVIDYFNSQKATPVSIRELYLPVGADKVTDKRGREWQGITGGYSDEILLSAKLGEAHCLDWKFGKEPVTPTADNVQGYAYVLGIFQEFPEIKVVTMHFYHPYQNWSEEQQEEKYIHTFTRDDIPRMELRIRTIIARKHSMHAKPVARVDLCLWCAKKGTCEANANAIIKVSEKYPELLVPDVCAPHKLALPSQLAAAHKFASQVELWAKAVKMRCTDAVLIDGIDVPGYRLIKRQDRMIQSLKILLEQARKNGLNDEQLMDLMTISLTGLEKAVKANAPKGKGAAAIRQLASDLEESGATIKGNPIHFLQEIKSPAQEQETIST